MDFKFITTSAVNLHQLLLTVLLSDLRTTSINTSTLCVFILGHLKRYMQGFKDVSAFYRNVWERLPYGLHAKRKWRVLVPRLSGDTFHSFKHILRHL